MSSLTGSRDKRARRTSSSMIAAPGSSSAPQFEDVRIWKSVIPKLGTAKTTVLVGYEGNTREFIVHTDLLKRHSKLFDGPSFPEIFEENPVRLALHSPGEFEFFCSFIYTGKVYSILEDGHYEREWSALAKLWVLAKSLQSDAFKDAVVDAFMHLRVAQNRHPARMHEKLSRHFHEPSGLRTLLVDFALADWQGEDQGKRPLNGDCLPFYQHLMTGLRELAEGENSFAVLHCRLERKSNCRYHEHDPAEPCYKQLCPTSCVDVRCKRNEMPDIGTMMLEVHVGAQDDIDHFLVHAELATRHSKVIATALKKCWNGGKERALQFPEVSPETFQGFYDFVNTGRISFSVSDDAEDQDWSRIADAWLLGEFLDSTSFKDAVVDAMIACMCATGKTPTSMHHRVYAGSVSPSGMRTLLVDVAVFDWSPTTLAEQPDESKCAAFFRDVAVAERQRSRSRGVWRTAPYKRAYIACHYHDHGADELCYEQLVAELGQ